VANEYGGGDNWIVGMNRYSDQRQWAPTLREAIDKAMKRNGVNVCRQCGASFRAAMDACYDAACPMKTWNDNEVRHAGPDVSK
jgi:hypothetical protein